MKKVLLVEDERILAMALTHELTRGGYLVTSAVSNGADALVHVLRDKPDVIIMDICIEGPLDGIETAHSLAAVTDTPVVYLTGEADEATRNRAERTRQYSGYLLKPLNFPVLDSLLTQVMAGGGVSAVAVPHKRRRKARVSMPSA